MMIAQAFAIIFIGLPFLTTSEAHVVFEEFGTMAGSVSYMHVTLHINLTNVDALIKLYTAQALGMQKRSNLLFQEVTENWKIINSEGQRINISPVEVQRIERQKIQAHNVIESYIGAAGEVAADLRNLRGVLPINTQSSPSRSHYNKRSVSKDLTMKLSKSVIEKGAELIFDRVGATTTSSSSFLKGGLKVAKIFKGIATPNLAFSILKGVFGTFMGIYNTYQMEKMRSDLRGVISTQKRVIEVVEDHESRIDYLEKEMNGVKVQLAFEDLQRTTLLSAHLARGLALLQAAMRSAIHAVQQAHHHRLAIDHLDPGSLEHLYGVIEAQAQGSKYKLLTRFPSDLFQLEVSYLYDGHDVVLFLHVPMVPQESLLKLYRLKPFPIPFSDSLALLPKPSSSLLALTQSMPRAMTNIEHSDLIDCHQVNQVYVCERHGVLRNNIKSTCMGALFEQDIPLAQHLCELELVPYQEAVIQLRNNWFLIYSPTMFTAYVICLNSSSSAIPIKVGVNQVFISPSCKLELKNHTMTSDLSMKLDSEITYFQWQLTDMTGFGVDENDLREALELQASSGEKNLLLSDVLQQKHYSSRHPTWKILLILLILVAAIAVCLLIFFSLGTHRIIRFRRRVRRIRNAIDQLHEHRHQPVPQVEAAPPVYPGLPEDDYELMNFRPDFNQRGSRPSLRSLRSLSRHLRSRPVSRSRSVPPPDRDDLDSTHYATPKAKPRARTPSVALLDATVEPI